MLIPKGYHNPLSLTTASPNKWVGGWLVCSLACSQVYFPHSFTLDLNPCRTVCQNELSNSHPSAPCVPVSPGDVVFSCVGVMCPTEWNIQFSIQSVAFGPNPGVNNTNNRFCLYSRTQIQDTGWINRLMNDKTSPFWKTIQLWKTSVETGLLGMDTNLSEHSQNG